MNPNGRQAAARPNRPMGFLLVAVLTAMSTLVSVEWSHAHAQDSTPGSSVDETFCEAFRVSVEEGTVQEPEDESGTLHQYWTTCLFGREGDGPPPGTVEVVKVGNDICVNTAEDSACFDATSDRVMMSLSWDVTGAEIVAADPTGKMQRLVLTVGNDQIIAQAVGYDYASVAVARTDVLPDLAEAFGEGDELLSSHPLAADEAAADESEKAASLDEPA